MYFFALYKCKGVTVGLESNYTIVESEGAANVCVVLTGNIAINVTVNVSVLLQEASKAKPT